VPDSPLALTVVFPAEQFKTLARRVADLLRKGRDDNGVLNTGGAAALLGLSRKAVYHLVEREQLPHQRVGRRLLFDRADLRAWVEHGGCAHAVKAERLCTPTLSPLQSAGWQLVTREQAALERLERRLARNSGGSS